MEGKQMSELGERERVQILLAEYASLRSETNSRIASMYQSGGWAAAITLWFLTQEFNLRLVIGLVIGLTAIIYAIRMLSFDLVNAAHRVRQLEQEINRRAGTNLMVWESELAGLNKEYWKAVFFLAPPPGMPERS
jgi:hypothetical protein